MGFPISDVVMLSVLGAGVFAGLAAWSWLSQRTRNLPFELQPMTALLKLAPRPANEATEEAAPDSSIRIRPGARVRAVDSH
ncbi:MAG TPA: hypothetical protein PK156_36500 [Polyangium sp.]|nr:hypothetical protein [Polyangium sp.]